MGTGPLRVVLRMETSLLSSAIAQVLAGDPRLWVEIHPPGDADDAECAPMLSTGRPVVEVAVLEDPPRIELHADGHAWVLEYRGLQCLATLLAQCHDLGATQAVGAYPLRGPGQ